MHQAKHMDKTKQKLCRKYHLWHNFFFFKLPAKRGHISKENAK